MGVLHVKLSEVSLQQAGRRLLGLQGRGLPTNAQDPKTDTLITLCCCFAFFFYTMFLLLFIQGLTCEL